MQHEPGMLPEPNHVMLNHLYALSIKVSVVNQPHRAHRVYRKRSHRVLSYGYGYELSMKGN